MPTLLTTEETPKKKPLRHYDLTGVVVGESTIVECIGTHPAYGTKWRCFCNSCGRYFARYTTYINAKIRSGTSFSCSSCYEEFRDGVREQRREYRRTDTNQKLTTSELTHHPVFEETEMNALRELFFKDEEPPIERFATWELACSEVPATNAAKRNRIQNIFELYPIRVDAPAMVRCGYCPYTGQKGFACVCCAAVVCPKCVRTELHQCEHDSGQTNPITWGIHSEWRSRNNEPGWTYTRNGGVRYNYLEAATPERIECITKAHTLVKVKVTKEGPFLVTRRAK